MQRWEKRVRVSRNHKR